MNSKSLKRCNFRNSNWTQSCEVRCHPPHFSTANLYRAYSSLCNLLFSAAKVTIPCQVVYHTIGRWVLHPLSRFPAPGIKKQRKNAGRRPYKVLISPTPEGLGELSQSSHRQKHKIHTFPCVCEICHCKTTPGKLEVESQQGAGTSCQTRYICPMASPWSWRICIYSFCHPGAYASCLPSQEWIGTGPRNIPPEVPIHRSPRCLNWIIGLYSNCLSNMTVPKIWHKATVITIPKPNKSVDNQKTHCPISLLCVPFQLLERLIRDRLEPIIYPQLPNEQAGFHWGRGTVNQIVNFTADFWFTEESFENGRRDLNGPQSCFLHCLAIGSYPEAILIHTILYRHLVWFIYTVTSNAPGYSRRTMGQISSVWHQYSLMSYLAISL